MFLWTQGINGTIYQKIQTPTTKEVKSTEAYGVLSVHWLQTIRIIKHMICLRRVISSTCVEGLLLKQRPANYSNGKKKKKDKHPLPPKTPQEISHLQFICPDLTIN